MSEQSHGIRRVVLDVLKLHEPDLVELATILWKVDCVDGVNITLVEVDSKTENIKITLVGRDLDMNIIRITLERNRATIHSIDQVVAGSKIVEAIETPQD
ncbi:MAG: DUF211 domain-containing protein [Candidatus Hodarchaeales archaeon]|jgi:hypothetical protein